MSVKHIEQYFKEIADQYKEAQDDFKELQEYAESHIMEPERIDRMKEELVPLMNNYKTLSWIMYLLHQPNNPKKEPRYKQNNKKLLAKMDPKFSKQGVLSENREALDKMKNTAKGG